ncbi:MAG: cyclic nucleotide-binding domain-containing protein [Hyphomicrobiaceae bacterium]|nr:cyclic nucleotide-binding domain-containing protein [Hyphomicrobiaceae bacterium]
MEVITSIRTRHRAPHLRIDTDHRHNETHPFHIADLVASPQSCRQLREAASKKTLSAGETLFWEDDPADYVYFAKQGTIKAYKLLPNGRSQIIRFVVAGEVMASSCLHTHSYSAEALGDCTVLMVSRKRLEKILATDPELMKSLTQKLSEEMQKMQKQILLLGRMPAIERVSNFLLDIAVRQKPENTEFEPGFLIELPMARTDIADYLGLTIETVSRAFSKFRRDGLIDLPRPNLVLLRNQTGLQQQSQA